MSRAVHFVGVPHPAIQADAHYEYMVRIFGEPDFVHTRYDARAVIEIMDGDTVIFTRATAGTEPNVHAYDDSSFQ